MISPRDLQTEWEPATFDWKRVPLPILEAGGWCTCLGSTTPEEVAAGLCRCAFERRFGVWDRVIRK